MSFRSVFVALVIGFGLVIAGYLVNRQRPAVETGQPTAKGTQLDVVVTGV